MLDSDNNVTMTFNVHEWGRCSGRYKDMQIVYGSVTTATEALNAMT